MVIQKDSSELCFGPCEYASRITVGGTFDGDVNIGYGANFARRTWPSTPPVRRSPRTMPGYTLKISSSLGVSAWTNPPVNNVGSRTYRA